MGDGTSDYIDDFGGTSSSTPGAAGTAALILSANPDLNWQEVRDIIKDTCEKIDVAGGQYNTLGHSKKYGYGKVDADKAVQKAVEIKNGKFSGKVKIISALIDPAGIDTRKEKLSLRNTSSTDLDLGGWSIEVKGKKQVLNINWPSGQSKTISLNGQVKLNNTGATIKLLDDQEQIVDKASYKNSR